MRKLHLGSGKNPLPAAEGWTNLDMFAHPGTDVVFDLEDCAAQPLPFEDDAFDEVYGSHVLEHIRNSLPFMQELHRVCKADAKILFRLPYGGSDDAWENPTHVRPYFLNSFGFFSQPFYWREDYGYKGDFLTEKIDLLVPKPYAENQTPEGLMYDVEHQRNIVGEMHAHLKVVKPIREAKKELQQAPQIQFVLI